MKILKFGLALSTLIALGVVGSTASADVVTFQGGNLNTAGNWVDENGVSRFPVSGDTGIIDVNSTFSGSRAGDLSAGGDLIFGGGSTLTATTDFVGTSPDSVTFNEVTLNVDDDIFNGGEGVNFIFNTGSVTNVDDDFQANGGSTITVNGGTHNVGIVAGESGEFGTQNGSTLNFFGGVVDAVRFRNTGITNLAGDAVLTSETVFLNGTSGTFDISSAWTGSLTSADQSGTSWETTLLTGNATFDGAAIDASVFSTNFELSNGGQTVSLVAAVPEPSSLMLLGFGLSGLLAVRRR